MSSELNGVSRRPGGRRAGTAGTVIVIVIAIVVAVQQSGKSRPGAAANRAQPTISATRESERLPKTGSPSPAAITPEATSERPERPGSKPESASSSAAIRLGTWNIEWLGRPDKRSGLGMNTAQSADDMADYIVASGVAVLAVEEIVAQTQGSARVPRSTELEGALGAVERRTGEPWRYLLFAERNDGDQCTGVAWNTRVVTALDPSGSPVNGLGSGGPQQASGGSGLAWRVPVKSGRGPQGSGLWNRPPHALMFSAGAGRTDFTVVVVHMKADYEGDFAAHRAQEAGALAEALPAARRAFRDQDVVVLGDTNMTSPDEPAKAAFEAAGLVDLNRKAETTHWRGGATDRIFVPRDQPEFGGVGGASRFEVMSDRYLDPKRWDPRDFKRRLSDHYMVVTTVAIMPDDD